MGETDLDPNDTYVGSSCYRERVLRHRAGGVLAMADAFGLDAGE